MKKILFYSTNLVAKEVNVKEAILRGLAEDKGLYLPMEIPRLENDEFELIKTKDYPYIAFLVMRKFLYDFVDDEKLLEICKDAYDFPVPIEKLDDKKYILYLDRGPTAAFKDFAARLMARLMQHFLIEDGRSLLILTATSGDTGSAVANAFYGMKNIKVVVLFPEREITVRQRKLMTTLRGNISAVAVDGKFDDCQVLVKDAFVDKELVNLNLSSANSINFARLMPQIVYYVYAYSRLGRVNFAVPSGNFGNLMAGLLAKKMGLPVNRFIVAVNENDEFVEFYRTGKYKKIVPSKNCVSNAMNVGHPSNFARLVALYSGFIDEKGNISKQPDMDAIRRDMWAYSVTDEQTREEIRSVYERYKRIVEPHGAVGLYAYERYLDEERYLKEKKYLEKERYLEETNDGIRGVCLETAHPAKFPETIKEVLNIEPEMPEPMKKAMEKKEEMIRIRNDYGEFKEFLMREFGE